MFYSNLTLATIIILFHGNACHFLIILIWHLVKKAHLKIQAAPEDINYEKNRELDRSLIRQLLTGQWLTFHHNLLITGATGVGKTYLICALATAACRQGFQVRYYRVSRLLQDIELIGCIVTSMNLINIVNIILYNKYRIKKGGSQPLYFPRL